MFAYILKVHAAPNEQAKEFFRRFKETPGLLHAFNLQGVDDPEDGVAVAIWENGRLPRGLLHPRNVSHRQPPAAISDAYSASMIEMRYPLHRVATLKRPSERPRY